MLKGNAAALLQQPSGMIAAGARIRLPRHPLNRSQRRVRARRSTSLDRLATTGRTQQSPAQIQRSIDARQARDLVAGRRNTLVVCADQEEQLKRDGQEEQQERHPELGPDRMEHGREISKTRYKVVFKPEKR